jgi:hypothetical protein
MPGAPSPPSPSATQQHPEAPLLFPSLPHTTEVLEKPPVATRSPFSPFSSRSRPSWISSPPSPPPTCLPHRLPPPETPPPLRFSSERHRLRRFTVRPSHPPPLSPIEVDLTFPLSHRHYRATPPSPPCTGALSLRTNAAVPRLLHCLHTAPPFG